MMKQMMLWVIVAVMLMAAFKQFSTPMQNTNEVKYSEFRAQLKNGNIETAVIDGKEISGKYKNGGTYRTVSVDNIFTTLVGEMDEKGIEYSHVEPAKRNILLELLMSIFPILLLVGIWIYFMRQMQGGGKGGAMSFGRSKAKLLGEDQVKVTFADVAGVDEAKEEVSEIVEFLRDPGKFNRLGGKIPRGVLMVGSPGTGKTLLAKAIAGEARVPFFTISGSDFVEMFVGVQHYYVLGVSIVR